MDLYRSEGRDTGSHSRTRGSIPGWGLAHIVHSHTGYLDHTVGSTPGDKAQKCNPADFHTFLTRNFAPAHNVHPEDNTAADVAAAGVVAADAVAAYVGIAVVDADYADDGRTVLQDCNQTDDIQALLDVTENSGKLHGVSYRSQAHSHSQPFFFDCCLVQLADFLLESLADSLQWHFDWSVDPAMYIL